MLRIGIPVAAAALLLDQLSKWWILAAFADPTREIAVTSFFRLVLAWNRGISFSLFRSDSPAAAWVFAGIALLIVAGLLAWLRRLDRAWPAVAIGLIVGGAVGNVIDRLRFGAVVDFLYFHGDAYPGVCRVLGSIGLGWLDCRWPAFNVADSAIFVGVALLLLDGLFGRAEKAKKASNQEVP
jgi:signal peptidase II